MGEDGACDLGVVRSDGKSPENIGKLKILSMSECDCTLKNVLKQGRFKIRRS
jgi:hypothetical protein